MPHSAYPRLGMSQGSALGLNHAVIQRGDEEDLGSGSELTSPLIKNGPFFKSGQEFSWMTEEADPPERNGG